MTWLRTAATATVAAALFLAGTGCGPPKLVKVKGTVTLGGQPLDNATVTFVPVGGKGQTASGRTGSDGAYQLTTYVTGDGALPGDYQVLITKREEAENPVANVAVNAADPSEALKKVYGGFVEKNMGTKQPKMAGPPKAGKSLIPARFGDPSKNLLAVTVPPPNGTADFDLPSK